MSWRFSCDYVPSHICSISAIYTTSAAPSVFDIRNTKPKTVLDLRGFINLPLVFGISEIPTIFDLGRYGSGTQQQVPLCSCLKGIETGTHLVRSILARRQGTGVCIKERDTAVLGRDDDSICSQLNSLYLVE